MNDLLTILDNKLPEMLTTLQQMVEFESPSNEKAAIDTLIDYLANLCSKKGLNTEVIKLADRGNHLKVTGGAQDATEKLLILCHIDTVWPLGTLEQIPFANKQGILTGPGVFDMKTGAMQAIYALETVLERGKALNKQITILFNSDEEIGSRTSRALIEELALQSKCVFVLEPSVPPIGALKTFRKGVGRFAIEITGRPSHAGSAPEKGISAVTELAHQILYIQGLADKEKGTTVNVGVVSGGTKTNVVPAKAGADIDVRVTTLAEGERITRDILGTKPITEGAIVKARGGMNRPPMIRTEKTIEMFSLAKSLAKELGFEIAEASTGGGSDGNFTAALGVPTIDGLGAVGAGGHAYDEHTIVEHIVPRTALLVRLLETI